jgi:DNA-binding beta-propeller fold protein YncE
MRSPWTAQSRRAFGKATGALLGIAFGGVLWLASCGDDLPARLDPMASKRLGLINRPTAAALDSEGQKVFVTGHDQEGLAQLYMLPISGEGPTLVQTSLPLGHPVGLAIDANDTLYIADIGTDDGGILYKGDTAGMLTVLAADSVRSPSGITLSPDGKDVYITGRDKADGQPGVFKIASGDGAVSVVAKGAPFSNPSSLTFSNDGTLYVMDPTAISPTGGAVIRIVNGTAEIFSKNPLTVGFAAGIAASGASDLLITSNSPGSASVLKLTSAGDVVPSTLMGDALNPDGDPATIHQAVRANAWVVVDTATPPQDTPGALNGAVLLLTP